jgi:hypothetical protein
LSIGAGFLQGKGGNIQPGLSDIEIGAVEDKFLFTFPTDLRQLLQTFLPVGDKFPIWRNLESEELRVRIERPFEGICFIWRNLESEELRVRIERPFEGICFDIEDNNFWMKAWGEKPINLRDAFDVAKLELSKVPTLIPIYSHRYMPSPPTEKGNPVLSVYQTDIIYYGYDLTSYLCNEFQIPLPKHHEVKEPKSIEFWNNFLE